MNHVTSVPFLRRVLQVCAFGLGALAAVAAPTNVLIRVPAGTASPAELPELLAKWRQSGQVANVLFLTQGKPEKAERTARFESLAVLEFQSEGSYEAWQRDAAPALPAGLIVLSPPGVGADRPAERLARPVRLRPATLATSDEVRIWVEDLRQRLLDEVKQGPVIVG